MMVLPPTYQWMGRSRFVAFMMETSKVSKEEATARFEDLKADGNVRKRVDSVTGEIAVSIKV